MHSFHLLSGRKDRLLNGPRSRVFRAIWAGLSVVAGAAFLAVAIQAQVATSGKPAPTVSFNAVDRDAIKARLKSAPHTNPEREAALERLFEQSGCKGASLSEQPVSHEDLPNVICIEPGSSGSVIIVGAHYDKVARGGGVVDNWSGASLLPSLFESLHQQPRKHTFIFVGFTAEEQGLIGSKFFVRQMTPQQVAETRAMVNIDTLALGPTKIWLNHSAPKLAGAFFAMAQSMRLPVAVMNADNVGDDDSESFIRRKIPTLMVHSVTQPTLRILHTNDDNYSAVKFDDYYDSYRLLAAYLAYLDTTLP
jgi:Peptidase family M28